MTLVVLWRYLTDLIDTEKSTHILIGAFIGLILMRKGCDFEFKGRGWSFDSSAITRSFSSLDNETQFRWLIKRFKALRSISLRMSLLPVLTFIYRRESCCRPHMQTAWVAIGVANHGKEKIPTSCFVGPLSEPIQD